MSETLHASGASNSGDARWMRHALSLAEKSIGLASPNPVVGSVLVREQVVVGRGAHIYDNLDHAEIVALREAGTQAHGATAYVTLEPCSHTGRTGPCAEALIRAGVTRVVVATQDPNPLVSGRGVSLLREAGIAVTVGVLAEQARQINDGFARYIRRKLPLVTLKAGLSLDGRIAPARLDAPAPAQTTYLTSPHSLVAVQRMRHASEAVMTGIGTVLHDNPLLTDRSGLARRRPLLRVVLDSALRLPLDSRLVQSARGDLLVYTTDADNARADALRSAGVEIEQVGIGASAAALNGHAPGGERCSAREEKHHALAASSAAGLDLGAVLASLGERRGIVNLLAECGSRLNGSLLAEELVDKLCLFYAPLLLGEGGVPLVAGVQSRHAPLSGISLSRFGDDFRFEAYLRDPWR